MLSMTTTKHLLFVDKASGQWVVLSPEGGFWIVPAVEDAWRLRQPFLPDENTELAPVPGHYKQLFQLPP